MCNNLTKPNKPLSNKIIEDSFKVFMNDTGLLMTLMDAYDPADIVLKDRYPLYHYSKPDSTLEIDFVTEFEGMPILLDVKSSRNKRAKSLSTLMKEKERKRKGFKIMDSNIEVDEQGIIHLPLYAPRFFKEVKVSNIPEPPSAENLNERFLHDIS